MGCRGVRKAANAVAAATDMPAMPSQFAYPGTTEKQAPRPLQFLELAERDPFDGLIRRNQPCQRFLKSFEALSRPAIAVQPIHLAVAREGLQEGFAGGSPAHEPWMRGIESLLDVVNSGIGSDSHFFPQGKRLLYVSNAPLLSSDRCTGAQDLNSPLGVVILASHGVGILLPGKWQSPARSYSQRVRIQAS